MESPQPGELIVRAGHGLFLVLRVGPIDLPGGAGGELVELEEQHTKERIYVPVERWSQFGRRLVSEPRAQQALQQLWDAASEESSEDEQAVMLRAGEALGSVFEKEMEVLGGFLRLPKPLSLQSRKLLYMLEISLVAELAHVMGRDVRELSDSIYSRFGVDLRSG